MIQTGTVEYPNAMYLCIFNTTAMAWSICNYSYTDLFITYA